MRESVAATSGSSGTCVCAAAAFDGYVLAEQIDRHATHRPAGNREEVPSILPVDVAGPGEAHERLVDERRGLQQIGPASATQVLCGPLAQLLVEERGQPAIGILVARVPRPKQECDLTGARIHPRLPPRIAILVRHRIFRLTE